MNLDFYLYYYWPIIILISLTKPISDFFWLRKFENENSFFNSVKSFFKATAQKKYLFIVIFGSLFWSLSYSLKCIIPSHNFEISLIILLFLTIIFMIITIITIKSILVIGLIIVTFANFLLIQLFQPLTLVSDLATLNSLLSNLISTFNYIAIATAAVGLVWQFGRHNNEDVYGTISTMFYAVGYILLNMFISFIYLFIPTVNQINSLS